MDEDEFEIQEEVQAKQDFITLNNLKKIDKLRLKLLQL